MNLPEFLDDRPVTHWRVGHGSLGQHGQLGYEHKPVQVLGRRQGHALSAHGPSEVDFIAPPAGTWFEAAVALNDDVTGRRTSADFIVEADQQVLAVAAGVRPGEPVRALRLRLPHAKRLSLRVETAQPDYCHSVWLDPRFAAAPADPVPAWRDALARVELAAGWTPPAATERAIATVATPGFAGLLDQLLGSITNQGECPEARRYVFAIEADADCAAVIRRHGAVAIPCHRLAPLNQGMKAVLYSAASVIPAQHLVCLDADTLVLGDLRPLFAALAGLPPERVLVTRDAYLRPGPLGEQLVRHYSGAPSDLARLLGTPDGEATESLVINDGVFATSRRALLGVESFLRSQGHAIAWLDQHRTHGWRNQFLFNLALARLRCGVELDETFNLQMHVHDVHWSRPGGDRIRAHWRGRPAHLLHFCGWGRDKYRDWRQAAGQLPAGQPT